MARRSLKPQLNQIRAWVHQGRTDAWIAHQLEISATELREFRKQYDLSPDDENAGSSEIDLRDEIEAEIEAAAAEQEDAEEERTSDEDEDDEEADEDSERPAPARRRAPTRRRRRGPPRRARPAQRARGDLRPWRDDGYGLWLDAAVKDNPVYTEHWAGKRDVTVRIEADQIVIRRAGSRARSPSDDGLRATQTSELAAAGEIAGTAQVEPERGVRQRLRVSLRRRGRRRSPPAGTSRCHARRGRPAPPP